MLEQLGLVAVQLPAVFVQNTAGCQGSNGVRLAKRNAWHLIGAGTTSVGLFEDDIVIEVDVTTNPNNPTTEFYQNAFAEGIAAEAVGVDIDLLDVTRVSGSSLTSGGFREAIASIKADALEG